MLRGTMIGLRAVSSADLPGFLELYNDPALLMSAGGRPWRPQSLAEAQARHDAAQPSDASITFAVEELATGDLAGGAQLWGVGAARGSAHLGFSLRAAYRGRGLGTDTVRVLCDYAFRVRGLHRLQVETAVGNAAARAASEAAGFRLEGRLRRSAWVSGRFEDEVIYGRLATDPAP